MNDGLIYDWNQKGQAARPSPILLLDETLRDGLQSPSVRAPRRAFSSMAIAGVSPSTARAGRRA